MARLLGLEAPGPQTIDEPAVVIAHELTPADTSGLDMSKVIALVTEVGGPTSHTAIIARQLGIPCIVGTGKAIRRIKNDTPVLVDGAAGTVVANPDPDKAAAAVAESADYLNRVRAWRGPGRTSDGYGVELLANVGSGEAAAKAAAGVEPGPVEVAPKRSEKKADEVEDSASAEDSDDSEGKSEAAEKAEKAGKSEDTASS